MANQQEINAFRAVEELIESELFRDYGSEMTVILKECKRDGNDIYLSVQIKEHDDVWKYLRFRADNVPINNIDDDDLCTIDLYIDIGEDNFEKVTSYDQRCKYFWLAFLEWPKRYTEQKQ